MGNLITKKISEEHLLDVEAFSCGGSEKVEHFLKEHALNLEQEDISRTHLVYENDKLIGYFSLFVDTANLFEQQQKKYQIETGLNITSFPAIRIHCFGVDKKYQGRGYGIEILLMAMKVCYEISKKIGVCLIILEADINVEKFYLDRGFTVFQKRSNREDYSVLGFLIRTLRAELSQKEVLSK